MYKALAAAPATKITTLAIYGETSAGPGADPGDTLIGFHTSFYPGSLTDIITASLTAPTGDRSKGMGTGQVTYDFNNHTERYFNKLGFLVDLLATGVGFATTAFFIVAGVRLYQDLEQMYVERIAPETDAALTPTAPLPSVGV